MSRAAMALLAIAIVIAAGQWVSVRAAAHVDLHLLPDHSRRRLQRMVIETRHVQAACLALAVAAVIVQVS